MTGQELKYSEKSSAFKVALIRITWRVGLCITMSFKTSSRKSLEEIKEMPEDLTNSMKLIYCEQARCKTYVTTIITFTERCIMFLAVKLNIKRCQPWLVQLRRLSASLRTH